MSDTLKAIVIDDERYARESLSFMLHEHCPEIEVVAMAGDAREARQVLSKNAVDILFLDVSMPRESGFDLLDSLSTNRYQVVFVTASQEHALRAIKACAADYLLKPVNVEELKSAVKKVKEIIELKKQSQQMRENYAQSLNGLVRNMSKGEHLTYITLPYQQRFHAVSHNDIFYLEADDNYTNLWLVNGNKMLASKTLKEFEELLEPQRMFFRIHKSYIVNLKFIRSFSKGEQATVLMSNNVTLPLSRRRQLQFSEQWSDFSSGQTQ